jgi:hypothetical protein
MFSIRFLFLSILSIFIFEKNIYAQSNQYNVVCVAFYNLENLFDTINDPKIRDDDFTPDGNMVWTSEKYVKKLNNLSEVIELIGKDFTPDGPAVLGVSEIENRKVLEDLVQHEKIRNRNYQIIHYDSPDFRGIDVGLIYNPKYFRQLESRTIGVNLTKLDGKPLISRDVLYVKGILDGDTTHIMVNHWPSRRGGEAATRPLRNGCALVNRKISDSLLLDNPNAKIIIMGDFNDNPNNESILEILSAKGKKKKVSTNDLFNPFSEKFNKGIGTLAYQDAWSLFDQIVFSSAYINKSHKKGYNFFKSGIYNRPFLQQKTGRFKGYPLRTFDGDSFINGYSDHFPVYIILIKPL